MPRTLSLLSSPSGDPGLTPASLDLCFQENVFWPRGDAEASWLRFSPEKMTRGRPRPAEDGLQPRPESELPPAPLAGLALEKPVQA